MKSVAPMDVVEEVVEEVEEEDEEEGDDGVDDIFGSGGHGQRNGGGSLYLARARPTMISAKYRLKEERRKVLKISVAKLKRIDDPESSLRRSVLINNTVRRLQREARDEKMQRQQSISHVSPYHHLLRPLIAPSHDSPSVAADHHRHSSKDHASPLDAPDIALSLPDLSDALVDDDPDQLPPRLSVESLDEGLDESDSSSSADPNSVLLRPSSRAQDSSDTDDDSTSSSSPPYIGFDSMETSFVAETETSDVFAAPTKSILDDGSRGDLRGAMDDVPMSVASSTAESSDPILCYGVAGESDAKMSGGCSSVVPVTCDAMSSVCSAEEEREACGALVNCLDELVEVTSLCRGEEDEMGGCKVRSGSRGSGASEEEDEEVEDVHSVLSQFYMPPTPRMLTSIDDEEEAVREESLEDDVAAAVEAAVEAVGATRSDDDAGEAMVIASARQCGLPEPKSSLEVCQQSENSRKRRYTCGDDSLLMMDDFSEDMVLLEKESGKRQRLSGESRQSGRKQSQARPRRIRNSSLRDGDGDSENSQTTQFSCGHASIFGELQSVVFHSLIASLES